MDGLNIWLGRKVASEEVLENERMLITHQKLNGIAFGLGLLCISVGIGTGISGCDGGSLSEGPGKTASSGSVEDVLREQLATAVDGSRINLSLIHI